MMKGRERKYDIAALGSVRLKAVEGAGMPGNLRRHEGEVDELWQEALKKKDAGLFNGTLPHVIKVERKEGATEIQAQFIEYKYFYAQVKEPKLKLGIRPVGVSGMIVFKDRGRDTTVFAERTEGTTEYCGFTELVPSGSIDDACLAGDGTVDFRAKLLSEFEEETGLSEACVRGIQEFALIFDTEHHVYDICSTIRVNTMRELFSEAFRGSREYRNPRFVPVDDLDEFVKGTCASIVPTSLAIIETYGVYREKFGSFTAV